VERAPDAGVRVELLIDAAARRGLDRAESFVRDLVDSGRYSTASEVLRDGLRLLEEREKERTAKLEWLRNATQEGVDSGDGGSAEEVFDELLKRYSNF
jgi:antitoxin ParD1/3/4